MADTPAITDPTPADGQQMNRSNDPEVTAAMDASAADQAMQSRRQRLAGEATGVGSIGFDDPGAFDVGAEGRNVQDEPELDDPEQSRP
jgi:hypothetical protein